MAISSAASIGIAVGAILILSMLLFCCIRGRSGLDKYDSESQSHHRRCRNYETRPYREYDSASSIRDKNIEWRRKQGW